MALTPQAYISRMIGFVGDDDPMDVLTDAPAQLSALVSSVDAETRARKPAPDKWSIDEIAAHMADTEVVTGYRLRMILAVNGTPLQAFDQDLWASAFNYQSCDAIESARLFAAYREGTLRVLRLVDKARLDHHGVHSERGIETVPHLLRFYAGHDRNHLEQIQRIIDANAVISRTARSI